VFCDVPQIVSRDEPAQAPTARRLTRIPTVANQKIVFVDTTEVCCNESDGHCCRVLTPEDWHFCNLGIRDLQERLDPDTFVRVHRCFVVNLGAIEALERDGTKTRIKLKRHPRVDVPVSRTEVAALRERLGLRAKTYHPDSQGFSRIARRDRGTVDNSCTDACISCRKWAFQATWGVKTRGSAGSPHRPNLTSLGQNRGDTVIPPSFESHAPRSVGEAVALLGRYGSDAKLIAETPAEIALAVLASVVASRRGAVPATAATAAVPEQPVEV